MAFPSTFLDLQVAVADKLRLDSPNATQRIKDWINQIYVDVAIKSEFVRASATSASLSAGATNVSLPAALVRLRMVQSKPAAGSYGPPMQRVSLDRLASYRAQSSTNAQATHYAVLQSTIEFWPPAVLNDVLQFWYSAKPTALSAATDTPIIDEPFASKLIEYGVLAEAADFLRDPSEQEYRQLYELWLQRFIDHLDKRAGDNLESRGLQPKQGGVASIQPEMQPAAGGRR